jgi:putative endonuclease
VLRWFRMMSQRLRAWRRPLSLGQRGEREAARLLRKLRYKIVAYGQRDLIGEIDLIAVDGRTIVFVEVKTRTGDVAGHPADAVDLKKQQRLTRLATSYLKRHDLLDCATRFDVVAVTWPSGSKRPMIEHFKDAFEAVGSSGMYS